MRLFITCLLAASFTVITAQNTLQYNLSVGDAFTVNQQAKQTITQDLNGTDQVIINDLVGAMHFKVINTDTDFITFEMTFKQIKMLMSSPTLGEMMNMDTATEGEDLMSLMMRGVLNQPVIIKMNKNGKMKSVTGGDALIQSMFKAAGITDPQMIEASKGQLEKQFGTEALTNSFEQMTFIFTKNTVKPGDTWTNEYKGDLQVKNNWTLQSLDEDSYKIIGDATVMMTTVTDTVTMALNGTQTTTAIGNSKTGLITELTVVGKNKGNSEMSGMTIPTTIESTITYKISQ